MINDFGLNGLLNLDLSITKLEKNDEDGDKRLFLQFLCAKSIRRCGEEQNGESLFSVRNEFENFGTLFDDDELILTNSSWYILT